MLHGLGIDTGIDLDALVEAGGFISDLLGREPVSRAGKALLTKRRAAAAAAAEASPSPAGGSGNSQRAVP